MLNDDSAEPFRFLFISIFQHSGVRGNKTKFWRMSILSSQIIWGHGNKEAQQENEKTEQGQTKWGEIKWKQRVFVHLLCLTSCEIKICLQTERRDFSCQDALLFFHLDLGVSVFCLGAVLSLCVILPSLSWHTAVCTPDGQASLISHMCFGASVITCMGRRACVPLQIYLRLNKQTANCICVNVCNWLRSFWLTQVHVSLMNHFILACYINSYYTHLLTLTFIPYDIM